jgi:hypothetical protein
MNFLELLKEGRVEDFKEKYGRKFSPNHLNKITGAVPMKYLEWVGKVIDDVNFDENIQKLVDGINKFEKISTNLPLTDINQYKSLDQLLKGLSDYENKPRRDFKQVKGGIVVYDDGRYFVVNPSDHETSCYYGKGTKWCTAADIAHHFNQFYDDGKLFYILDRSKPTNDPTYKVALLKKFDGNETFYDAKDDPFNASKAKILFGTDVYDTIMGSVNDYLQQEFSEQLKIFADKESAKKEKERIEKLRQRRILLEKEAAAQLRRDNFEWELGPDCPEVGLKAHALLKSLDDLGEVEARTSEDNQEISKIKTQIEGLQNEGGDNTEEIEELEQELEELINKIDVYNIIPTGSYYDTTEFEVINSSVDGNTYAVGDEGEIDSSAYESVEGLVDDIGYEGFSRNFVMNYLDTDAIESTAEDIYSQDVYNCPECYLSEDQRMLSREQESEIDRLENRAEKLKATIEQLKKEKAQHDNELIDEKIEELTDLIDEIETEIEEIRNDPDGDWPDDLVEDAIKNRVSEAMDDPEAFLNETGFSFSDYIDKDEFIKAVIDEDGYAHTLARYDGSADEVSVNGVSFYVMRID